MMLPVLFDLVLLSALMKIVLDAERLASVSEHARQLSVKAEVIFEHLSQAAVALSSNTKSREFLGFSSISTQVESDVESLKELARGNVNENRDAAQVQEITNRLMILLAQDRDRQQNRGYEFALGYNVIRQQINAMLERLKEKIGQIYSVEEQKELSAAAVSSRKEIKIAIVAGFICNVLLAFSLALYFNRGTTRRLQALMDNTNAFARGQELKPLMGGNDEIGRLDITFHEMARMLKEAAEKEEAMRIETDRMKADFTAMVIHDVRSPLATMRMFLDLITTEFYGPTPQPERAQAERVKRLIDRLLSLADRVLYFERLEAGEVPLDLKDHALAQIIDDAVHAVSGLAAEAGVKVTVASCSSRVLADGDQITRVLTNLLANAVKYSQANEAVSILSEEEDDDVVVSVVDSGPGIEEGQKGIIFDKYRQVQSANTKKGTGLGLAICKRIIEQHGGTIGVKDGANGGTVFWFKLPKLKRLSVNSSLSDGNLV